MIRGLVVISNLDWFFPFLFLISFSVNTPFPPVHH